MAAHLRDFAADLFAHHTLDGRTQKMLIAYFALVLFQSPTPSPQILIGEDRAYYLCFAVAVFGLLAVIAIWGFAHYTYCEQIKYYKPNKGLFGLDFLNFTRSMSEFWSTYAQVLIATILITLLTILLLTKTISAEAGLPILSAISGFAIARGVSGSRNLPTEKELPPPSEDKLSVKRAEADAERARAEAEKASEAPGPPKVANGKLTTTTGTPNADVPSPN